MHHDLKHRIQAMRDKLEGRAPVAEIQGSSQLFVTPAPECRRLVELADVRETDRILEPSAGTGAILQAIRDTVPRAKCDAVELHAGLVSHLQARFPEVRTWCGDFLEYHPDRRYTRIIMNPPFHRGDDIRHIRRALTLLEPGGILTGI
ncbi:class I SAM-dependent methyltransferase, partial [Klebsiella pneumoniae]|nr:class I SAM-dependent methyltransferase [Klebsiella pneumoniae]